MTPPLTGIVKTCFQCIELSGMWGVCVYRYIIYNILLNNLGALIQALVLNCTTYYPDFFFMILTQENKLISPLLLDGPVIYAAYLKTEHSDENIKFWMACETYKKTASQWSRTSRAKKLYKVYIQPQSPREVTTPDYARNGKSIPPRKALVSVKHTYVPAVYTQYLLLCYEVSNANLSL